MFFQVGNEKIILDFNNGITVKVGGPDLSYYVECVEYNGIGHEPLNLDGHRPIRFINTFKLELFDPTQIPHGQ